METKEIVGLLILSIFIPIFVFIFATYFINPIRMIQILNNNIGSNANNKPPTYAAVSLVCGGFVFIL